MIHIGFFPRYDRNGKVHVAERQIWSRRDLLREQGIYLLPEEDSKCDVIWCHTARATPLVGQKDGPPLIIDDQRDSATIRPAARKWLHKDRVKSLVKATAYFPRSLYNASHVGMTLHGRFCADKMTDSPPHNTLEFIPDELLHKIRIGWGYQYFDRYKELIEKEPLRKEDRFFDVHFMGTTDYGAAPIHWHRQEMVKQMKDLPHKVILRTKRELRFPEYCQTLRSSRIVLCPWGNGERTHREMEAWLAGCVVIRPNTTFVESWPDLYRIPTYQCCQVDWSDLAVLSRMLLPVWEHFVDHYARQMIVHSATDEAFCHRFRSIVSRCLEQA